MVRPLHPFRVLVSGNPLTLGLRPAGSPQAVLFAPFQGDGGGARPLAVGTTVEENLRISRDARQKSQNISPSYGEHVEESTKSAPFGAMRKLGDKKPRLHEGRRFANVTNCVNYFHCRPRPYS